VNALNIEQLDWKKSDGLLPAIIQHWRSGAVLMLGYMNREALLQTLQSGKVTFWSRTKQRLWCKGETSGNYLEFKSAHPDCDADAILILAEPRGPTCHRGTATCFGDEAVPELCVLSDLEDLIAQRDRDRPADSYTTRLFESGIRRIAQKVGEEGVETALAAVAQDDASIASEAADLIYHLLILLRARGVGLGDVTEVLKSRRRSK
jgi:phosphoribosyl-AMP cyclohydrolase / phosphoribosyl-ATP pyrophosphohydrolase